LNNFNVAFQIAAIVLLVLVALGMGAGLLTIAADALTRYFHRRDVAEGIPEVQYRVRYQKLEDGGGITPHVRYFDEMNSAVAHYVEVASAAQPGITNVSIDRRKVGTWDGVYINEAMMLS
jgi:hypothetical protein